MPSRKRTMVKKITALLAKVDEVNNELIALKAKGVVLDRLPDAITYTEHAWPAIAELVDEARDKALIAVAPRPVEEVTAVAEENSELDVADEEWRPRTLPPMMPREAPTVSAARVSASIRRSHPKPPSRRSPGSRRRRSRAREANRVSPCQITRAEFSISTTRNARRNNATRLTARNGEPQLGVVRRSRSGCVSTRSNARVFVHQRGQSS